jgi:hypothetical protein
MESSKKLLKHTILPHEMNDVIYECIPEGSTLEIEILPKRGYVEVPVSMSQRIVKD